MKKLLQLDKPLYMADKLTLAYENNSVSIRFGALSFEDPGKNRYSYILRVVDKDWILNTDNNMASYTNLPPGEYLFEVGPAPGTPSPGTGCACSGSPAASGGWRAPAPAGADHGAMIFSTPQQTVCTQLMP